MAEPNASAPFDAFNVSTWWPFINQDDPRMISFDLRCELESAYNVHSFSPKCQQALIKSLLLWATMSHAQRHQIPWNNERNLQLGQALIQHLLDLTAEMNGINTDEIYAALQAERHPFMKKVHEIMQARRSGGEGELHCQHKRALVVSEPRRTATTYDVSPALHRVESSQVSQRTPTVLAESPAHDAYPPACPAYVKAQTPAPTKKEPGASAALRSQPEVAYASPPAPGSHGPAVIDAAPPMAAPAAPVVPQANEVAFPTRIRPLVPLAEEVQTPFVPTKKHHTYSNSDDTVSSDSAVEAVPAASPVPSATAAVVPLEAAEVASPAPSAAAAPLDSVVNLQKYGRDGPEDLLQACLSELSADADGVTAWFERKLAITVEDRAIPLAAQAPPPMSLDKIKKRMTAQVVERFDKLLQYLYAEAPLEVLPHNEAAAFLSRADIEILAKAGLISACKKAVGPDTVIAFSVVENAEKGPLRHFLPWPRGSNRNALEDGYEPFVPLHHISSYLDAVNAPTGCVEALSSCFDQFLIPPDMQERFVFTDAANNRWCLTRLPMAHTVAAEIVQTLLATLSGHSSYVLPLFAVVPMVRVDVWVRTVRFHGTEGGVRQSCDVFRAACKECNVTLVPNHDGGSGVYNFVGVHFDHRTHKVCVDPENIRRIVPPQRRNTTRDLERQYTQLLFSASVLNITASKFYRLLRTVCWRLSQAMENLDLWSKPESLPQESYAQLEKWHSEVMHNVPRSVKKETLPNMSLFVELSTESWFSVLIGEETQETWNTGGSMEDILGSRVACACIMRAIECFQPCIENGAHVTILIIGGNTPAPNERLICENEPREVIADCIRTHLVARAFSFEVKYLGLQAP